MTDLEARLLDVFPEWLKALSDDALALSRLLDDDAVPEPARRQIAGALNYLFKSLDLIPDGIEDLGYIDDAFVFRVAACLVSPIESSDDGEAASTLARLSEDAALVREFIGDDYARLENLVRGLTQGTARGRSVEEIVGDAAVRSSLVSDVKGWAEAYVAPAFARDSKNLVKLKSFLSTKLPA